MRITAWKNFVKKINSTKRPAADAGTDIDVVLKAGTSRENPIFLIDGIDMEVNYIGWYDHYYFVTDIVLGNNNIYEIHCAQDVLATFKDDIGATSTYVLRSSYTHDGKIIDTQYPTKEGCITVNAFGNWSAGSDKCYIVGVINNRNSGLCRGGVHYYKMTESQMLSLNAFMLGGDYITEESDLLPIEVIKYLINPAKYLVSCKVFPVDITSLGNDPVVFGGWGAEFSASEPAKTTIINNTITIPKHPQSATYGAYVKQSPFSRYMLYVPCFGSFSIDSAVLAEAATLTVFISLDTVTGMGKLTVSDNNNHTYIDITTEVASNIGMAQMQDSVAGAAQLAISAVTNGMAGNVAGLAGNIASSTDSIQPQINMISGNGSVSNFTGFPELQAEFYEVVSRDDEHKGRPLCQVKTLSTIPGYILCSDASVNIAGTQGDKDAVNNLLNSGFYYE